MRRRALPLLVNAPYSISLLFSLVKYKKGISPYSSMDRAPASGAVDRSSNLRRGIPMRDS